MDNKELRVEIKERVCKSIDYILKNNPELTKSSLALELGLSRAVMTEILGRRMNPQLETVSKLNLLYNINYNFIFNGVLPVSLDNIEEIDAKLNHQKHAKLLSEKDEQSYTKRLGIDAPLSVANDAPSHLKNTHQSYIKKGGIETVKEERASYNSLPKVVTVDNSEEENILFVPVKASAGYQIGLGDPEYIETLPTFNIPNLQQGTFRAFEVQGDSMYQFGGGGLFPNDIVVANFVENPLHIRDNRVYVVVTKDDVLVKRCINRIESSEKLILNSDNKEGNYPPIVLHPSEVIEVWEFKARISRQIPANTVADEVIEIKAQLAIIQDTLSKK